MVPISYPDQGRALSRLSTPETPRARQSRGRWGSGRTEAGRPASRAAEIWKRGPGRAGAGRTLTGKEMEPSVAKHQPWLDQLPFLVEMEWLGPSYPPARSGHKSGRHRVLKTLGIGRGQWSLKDGDQRCGRREAWGGVQRGDPSGAQKPPSGGRQGWASGAQVHSRSQESRAGGAEGRTPAVCGAAVDSRAQVSAQGEGEGDPPGLTPDGARCRSHQPGWGNAEVTAPWAVFSEQGRTGLGLTSRLDQANHNSKT